ncbi:MAG TPA: trypsin-like peptidase domain-containing protein [Kofleriaceae bacterium]|nr:trypsin-like peptidase domain-containing protein [Kofleriaceae bacterium]
MPDPVDPPAEPVKDEDLLDAYSRAVMGVVDALGPAVASLQVRRGFRGMMQGEGSGVVVAPDGYVLTNSHVVHEVPRARVTLADGTRLDGQVIGDDPHTDLALVKVDASALPYAPIEPARIRPGQLCVAIGNPLGFHATVSAGVVSALGRSLRGRDSRLIDDVVQHTAPLNPGNSGGPLASSSGKVLGINTAIIAGSNSIGFAVSVTTAAWVLGQLMARGRVRRSWLGIGGHTRRLDRRLARAHGIEADSAVEIAEVTSGSPAAAAGLRDGDLLVAFAGKPVTSIEDLLRALRDWEPGRKGTLRVLSRGRPREVDITPREQA